MQAREMMTGNPDVCMHTGNKTRTQCRVMPLTYQHSGDVAERTKRKQSLWTSTPPEGIHIRALRA